MSSKDSAPDSNIDINTLCNKQSIRVLNTMIENDALPLSKIAHTANTSYQNVKKQIAYLKSVNLIHEVEIHGIPCYRLDKKHPVIQSLMRIKNTLEKD